MVTCDGKEITLVHERFQRPNTCPSCGASTYVDGAYTRCSNHNGCPSQQIAKINNWIKKTGIKYFGESRQEACFEAGLLKDPSDIYKITENQLAEIVGAGNAKNMMKEINLHRHVSLDIFMGSLGIKFLGRSNAKRLIDQGINSVGAFCAINPEHSFEGFKENLVDMRKSINEVYPLIMKFVSMAKEQFTVVEPTEQKQTNSDHAISGKTFCFTGVRIKGDIKEAFDGTGAIEKSGVSKDLDYLVTKDPSSTSSKIKKARDLGVQVISLEDLMKMIQGG